MSSLQLPREVTKGGGADIPSLGYTQGEANPKDVKQLDQSHPARPWQHRAPLGPLPGVSTVP